MPLIKHKLFLAVFAPALILGFLLFFDFFGIQIPYFTNKVIYNFLSSCFAIGLFGYQYYLGKQYLLIAKKESLYFKINALVPVIFYGLLFAQAVFLLLKFTFVDSGTIVTIGAKPSGPMRSTFSQIISLFLIHSFFALITNHRTIKKLINQEPEEGEAYWDSYYEPMKLSSQISIAIMLFYMVGIITKDVFHFF